MKLVAIATLRNELVALRETLRIAEVPVVLIFTTPTVSLKKVITFLYLRIT
jgi:hypothetical protein